MEGDGGDSEKENKDDEQRGVQQGHRSVDLGGGVVSKRQTR